MAKQAAKRTERRAAPRIALLAAFSDVPDVAAMMARYGLPSAFARCGFYCVRKGHDAWLFEKHPEKKVSAKVAEAGFELVRAVIETPAVYELLGANARLGFHTELDAKALATTFADEGFEVRAVPISKLASIAYGPSDPWAMARALLASGAVEIRALLDALYTHEALTPPPVEMAALLARAIVVGDDLRRLRVLLESVKAMTPEALVQCALPFIATVWRPDTAIGTPRGVPPELATLLATFDGIPPIGVLSAERVEERRAELMRMAASTAVAGKRGRGASDTAIRGDRRWREGWIPFCVRKSGEILAIDLEPTARGVVGQVIGVRLDPPVRQRYRASLGAWLWNELEGAVARQESVRGAKPAPRERAGSARRSARRSARSSARR